ncbi:hypothetical protein NQ314_001369 [Rhamnusium bicolor]|uniref:Uncharacterized protein n=1 Tax=Rhamnusium bicolor TaxID=1586634 RepID=A0AAV8ZV57_9CUCU|nr:hypothetical protein NQ314_001369 [Rhamnusium bicolor]
MKPKYILFFSLFVAINSCGDFYWRDYDGSIPSDAIPAENNSKGLSYIGQAYIHNYGLFLGKIIPGNLEISVPCYGVKKINVIIKILCAADKSKYYWISTNRARYRDDTFDKCPVLGGYDQKAKINRKLGTLHVGRTRIEGNVIIGNIAAYDPIHPFFYYPLNDTEIRASEYDVLIYSDNSVLPQ